MIKIYNILKYRTLTKDLKLIIITCQKLSSKCNFQSKFSKEIYKEVTTFRTKIYIYNI